jgi:hypothetical protein
VRPDESLSQPPSSDIEVERLSVELRDQIRNAKDRISERYGKLMEPRFFEEQKKA